MELSMTPVDVAVLVVLVITLILGLIRGFVMQLIHVGALVAGFALSPRMTVARGSSAVLLM